MSLCNLLVHLTTAKDRGVRLQVAADLARAQRRAPHRPVRPASRRAHRSAWSRTGRRATMPQAADASRAAFLAATQGLDAEWMDLNRGDESGHRPAGDRSRPPFRRDRARPVSRRRSADAARPRRAVDPPIRPSGAGDARMPATSRPGRHAADLRLGGFALARRAAFPMACCWSRQGTEALVVGLSKPNDAEAPRLPEGVR